MFIYDPKEPEGARASRPHPGRDDFAHALVPETLDLTWALTMHELEPEVIDDTLGTMLKYHDNIHAVRGEPVCSLLKRSRNHGPRGGRRRN